MRVAGPVWGCGFRVVPQFVRSPAYGAYDNLTFSPDEILSTADGSEVVFLFCRCGLRINRHEKDSIMS